jgi:hypothetical protein
VYQAMPARRPLDFHRMGSDIMKSNFLTSPKYPVNPINFNISTQLPEDEKFAGKRRKNGDTPYSA